ncbi:ABC transporter permease subunit [Bosea sp. NPDC055594]
MSRAVVARDWSRPGLLSGAAGRWLKGLPVLLFLAALMFVPVGQLLSLSFRAGDGSFSLAHYVRLFTADVYVNVMLVTLKIAAWTTVATVLASYPVAYLVATRSRRAKSGVMFWVLLAFWTSFLVRTFGWLVLLGRQGMINQFLQALGLIDVPANLLYTLPSVIVGMSHAMIPLCILTMVSVMETIDQNSVKAGLTLGARPGSAFWRIYFPLSLPGVAAGGLLVFITSLGFFITPAFLGGRFETMITQVIIEQIQEMLNWSFAGALSMLLLAVALVIFYVYDRLLGLSTLAGGGSAPARGGAGLSGWPARLGLKLCAGLGHVTDAVLFPAWRSRTAGERPRSAYGPAVQWVIAVGVVLFLCLPAFIMVPVSFTGGGTIDWPPRGFDLKWYHALFESPLWAQAALRSLLVALGTATLAMLLGTPVAFLLARENMRGKTVLLALILSPLIIPRMIIAVALFYAYAKLGLVGSYTGLILGHTVLAIPYVVITVMAVLKNYDPRYDQAAWNLGAPRLATLRRVTLPLIRTGLISAFLFALITSFDELTLALFVTGGLTTTLPKQMWDDALLSVTPTLAAASTLLLLLVTLLIGFVGWLERRSAR